MIYSQDIFSRMSHFITLYWFINYISKINDGTIDTGSNESAKIPRTKRLYDLLQSKSYLHSYKTKEKVKISQLS